MSSKKGWKECQENGFHTWSYKSGKSIGMDGVEFISEDLDEIVMSVECTKCGAYATMNGSWDNPDAE